MLCLLNVSKKLALQCCVIIYNILLLFLLFFGLATALKIWSLGEVDSDEKTLLTHFFQGLDKYTPTLVLLEWHRV